MNDPRFLLFIAHPGHELRVFHWITIAKPRCLVLTDGSGPDRSSRLASTDAILQAAGARIGPIHGRFPDRELYRCMAARDSAPFIALAAEVLDEILSHRITAVAGDMIEGFNTGHDMTRLILNAAVERAWTRHGLRLANYEFPLERLLAPDPMPPGAIVLALDDDDFSRKKEMATASYPELAGEIERVTARHGDGPFRIEWLLPADPEAGMERSTDEPPFYEVYGARQVAEGHYDSVITYRDHIRPLAHALRAWALA